MLLAVGILVVLIIVIGFGGMVYDERKVDKQNKLAGDLEKAIAIGDLRGVDSAIEQGVDVNKRLSNDTTALVFTIENKASIEIFRAIINAGAWTHAGKKNDTLLMVAIINRVNPDVVKMLLQAGADPNEKGGFGSSALTKAVQQDS